MQYILIALFILMMACLIVVIWDTNRFVVKKYTIISEKVERPFHFVFLSDLHNKEYGNQNEKLVKKIEQIAPDVVLCGGDLLNAKPRADFRPAIKLLGKLKDKFPVYCANGNHEFRLNLYPEKYGEMGRNYFCALKECGIEPLINDKVILNEGTVAVYGLEIEKQYYKRFKKEKMPDKYVNSLLGEPDSQVYSIIMAHNPEYFEDYAQSGADLILSGHIHGGVARFPFGKGVISPSMHLFPRYDGGKFIKNGTTMILSRGLGVHTIPVRFMNPGELIEVTIKS